MADRHSRRPPAEGAVDEEFVREHTHGYEEFAAQARAAALIELGREYREAGLDPSGTMRDAVESRVEDSLIASQLRDLCPSLLA